MAKKLPKIDPGKNTKNTHGFAVSVYKGEGRDYQIPYARCEKCLQYLSLHGITIRAGKVLDDVVCPNDGHVNREFELDNKINKERGVTFLTE